MPSRFMISCKQNQYLLMCYLKTLTRCRGSEVRVVLLFSSINKSAERTHNETLKCMRQSLPIKCLENLTFFSNFFRFTQQ